MKPTHNNHHQTLHAVLAATCAALLLIAAPTQARTSLSGLQTEVDQLQTDTTNNSGDIADNTQALCDLFDSLGQSLPLNCPPSAKIVFVTNAQSNGVLGGILPGRIPAARMPHPPSDFLEALRHGSLTPIRAVHPVPALPIPRIKSAISSETARLSQIVGVT